MGLFSYLEMSDFCCSQLEGSASDLWCFECCKRKLQHDFSLKSIFVENDIAGFLFCAKYFFCELSALQNLLSSERKTETYLPFTNNEDLASQTYALRSAPTDGS